MDEMSDDERNSEHDLEDYDGEKGPEGGDFGDGIGVGDGIGNDDGGEGGIAGVGTRVRVKREGGDEAAEEGEGKGGGGVIKAEEVRRWGVVLVGEDGLEGECLFAISGFRSRVSSLESRGGGLGSIKGSRGRWTAWKRSGRSGWALMGGPVHSLIGVELKYCWGCKARESADE